MSNYEYEKQKADDARHRREVEQAAQATALAAQKAARAAEMARLEQNASLRKQEQIAETNSFRNTVLGALPLIEQNKKTSYIIEQITTRLHGFENNSLKIEQNKVLEILGINKIIYNSNNEFVKTPEFSNYILIETKISEILKSFGIKDSTKEQFLKREKFTNIIGLPFLFLVMQGIQVEEGKRFQFKPLFFIASIVIVIVVYLVKKAMNKTVLKNFDELNNLQAELSKLRQPLFNIFLSIINKNNAFKICMNLDSEEIAKSYFENVYSAQIMNEQSFLPPELRPPTEEWIKFFNSRSAPEQINAIKSQINSAIIDLIILNKDGMSTQ